MSTSILLAHSFHFSFCATPKRCSSSTTSIPKSLNTTFLLSNEWVPMRISIDPSSTPLRICFFSDVVRNRLSTSTFTPNGAKRFKKVWKCCCAKTVVGTSTATCFPLITALKMARIATSVLPKPTSPASRRSIGTGLSMDSLISAVACNWSSVSSYGNASSNSCCHGWSGKNAKPSVISRCAYISTSLSAKSSIDFFAFVTTLLQSRPPILLIRGTSPSLPIYFCS